MVPHPLVLETDIQFMKGVGPVRAGQLRRLGITQAGDLLHHYPHDYDERGAFVALEQLREGMRVTTEGTILDVQSRRTRQRRTLLTVMIGNLQSRLRLSWFNASYLAKRFRVGEELRVSGEVTAYGGRLQIVNGEFENEGDDANLVEAHPRPRYPLTAGLNQGILRKLTELALDQLLDQLDDPLDVILAPGGEFMPLRDAVRKMHRPESLEQALHARERLAFDEAFALQLAVGQRRQRRLRRSATFALPNFGELSSQLVEGLGFELTGAQRKVLSAVGKDLRAEMAMHRLVQGDVGCGKTVVALIAMLWIAEAGAQAVLMAPTEVLARQHGSRNVPLLESMGLRAAVLTGSTPAAERREILMGLRDGSIRILFGTQALIQDKVEFRQLGLAVVDEQHRFGVMQRATLASSGAHLMVMTATPIPRSLALTLYGDLDLSVIDEMPPGRLKVATSVISEAKLARCYAEVRRRAAMGERSYLVYPLVDESEGSDLSSAKTAHEELCANELKGLRVALLHGKLTPREKRSVSEGFAGGDYDAVVATTVVEVGLDVPEATLMIIHHAERFGLAQLHQLRGRVGRGSAASQCVLVHSPAIGQRARERLITLRDNHDGLALAEADLLERGMGDLYGFRQHGDLPFRALSPLRDESILSRAKDLAWRILDADPSLASSAHRPLRNWLDAMGRRSSFWSASG